MKQPNLDQQILESIIRASLLEQGFDQNKFNRAAGVGSGTSTYVTPPPREIPKFDLTQSLQQRASEQRVSDTVVTDTALELWSFLQHGKSSKDIKIDPKSSKAITLAYAPDPGNYKAEGVGAERVLSKYLKYSKGNKKHAWIDFMRLSDEFKKLSGRKSIGQIIQSNVPFENRIQIANTLMYYLGENQSYYSLLETMIPYEDFLKHGRVFIGTKGDNTGDNNFLGLASGANGPYYKTLDILFKLYGYSGADIEQGKKLWNDSTMYLTHEWISAGALIASFFGGYGIAAAVALELTNAGLYYFQGDDPYMAGLSVVFAALYAASHGIATLGSKYLKNTTYFKQLLKKYPNLDQGTIKRLTYKLNRGAKTGAEVPMTKFESELIKDIGEFSKNAGFTKEMSQYAQQLAAKSTVTSKTFQSGLQTALNGTPAAKEAFLKTITNPLVKTSTIMVLWNDSPQLYDKIYKSVNGVDQAFIDSVWKEAYANETKQMDAAFNKLFADLDAMRGVKSTKDILKNPTPDYLKIPGLSGINAESAIKPIKPVLNEGALMPTGADNDTIPEGSWTWGDIGYIISSPAVYVPVAYVMGDLIIGWIGRKGTKNFPKMPVTKVTFKTLMATKNFTLNRIKDWKSYPALKKAGFVINKSDYRKFVRINFSNWADVTKTYLTSIRTNGDLKGIFDSHVSKLQDKIEAESANITRERVNELVRQQVRGQNGLMNEIVTNPKMQLSDWYITNRFIKLSNQLEQKLEKALFARVGGKLEPAGEMGKLMSTLTNPVLTKRLYTAYKNSGLYDKVIDQIEAEVVAKASKGPKYTPPGMGKRSPELFITEELMQAKVVEALNAFRFQPIFKNNPGLLKYLEKNKFGQGPEWISTWNYMSNNTIQIRTNNSITAQILKYFVKSNPTANLMRRVAGRGSRGDAPLRTKFRPTVDWKTVFPGDEDIAIFMRNLEEQITYSKENTGGYTGIFRGYNPVRELPSYNLKLTDDMIWKYLNKHGQSKVLANLDIDFHILNP